MIHFSTMYLLVTDVPTSCFHSPFHCHGYDLQLTPTEFVWSPMQVRVHQALGIGGRGCGWSLTQEW